MPSTETVHLPPQFSVDTVIAGNRVRQLLRPEFRGDVKVSEGVSGRAPTQTLTRTDGSKILIAARRPRQIEFDGDVLLVNGMGSSDHTKALTDPAAMKWIRPAPSRPTGLEEGRLAAAVLAEWRDKFHYKMEDQGAQTDGLRPPQMGALFATLAHWIETPEAPATIVMPTGTGKTETMLAILTDRRVPRLMVVVPNSALREQISNKFLTLGVLKACGVLDEGCAYPVVGTVEHHFRTGEEAESFLKSCNVVVTTIQAVNTCSEDVRRKIAGLCSHLVIDEAHHVSAPSWSSFKQAFHGKPILQFTATPFRTDGKQVGGKMIFTYPLRKAQEDGYFQKINFRPVFAFVNEDLAIAEAAVAQLRSDLGAGLDHIVMARVDSIDRAKEVHEIYRKIAVDENPLVIHSGLLSAERREALASLRGRKTRIVVCVDMLGEGFDLPQLKIAALHDVHKSLAITIQFTGRFTRVLRGGTVGDATIVANRASVDVQQRLRALYAEDADWNRVICDLSSEATGGAEHRSEFSLSFPSLPVEVPIQNLSPKMSTVAYRTTCGQWDPEGVRRVFTDEQLYTKQIAVSEKHRIAWFVTEQRTPIAWGDVRGLEDTVYDLYVLHWDDERNVLFIYGSSKGSVFEELAKEVAGETAAIIRGTEIYRSLHGIQRMLPTNLGLLDFRSRARRFTMHTGADVSDGLGPSQTQTKTKTNVFGFGFENGERTSVGCSTKGRVWSYLVANDLAAWMDWCRRLGAKLTDDSISPDEVFQGFIKPERVEARPALVPLAIEWPLEFLAQQEDRVLVRIGTEEAMFLDADLEMVDHRRDGPIRFRVAAGGATAEYEIVFSNEGTRYRATGDEAVITIGKRSHPLSEWLSRLGPKIHFEQDTFIERDLLLRVERDIAPLALDRLDAWDWTGTNIKVESQTELKRRDSIQRRVLDELLAQGQPWDLVFDDDDAGEIADVVAVQMTPDTLRIHLFHCKYSGGPEPGGRVVDLYEVCGQSQKSVRWRERTGLGHFVTHLLKRERGRITAGKASRFEKGDFRLLEEIESRREALKPEFKIWIVQPGVSKQRASEEMLRLLEATALYLQETSSIEMGVITSA